MVTNDFKNQRLVTLITGLSLLIMAIAAFFSTGLVNERLIVQGDPNSTYQLIANSQLLFKAGIACWLVILITDIVVSWGFYIVLRPINKSLSLLGGWFRLIYTAILAIAILHLLMVQLLTSKEGLIGTEQTSLHTMFYLQTFDAVWNFGLIIFGFHLLIVGYIAFQSSVIPKIISILLLIASLGYIVIQLCITFFPDLDSILSILEFIFILPMIAGELGFGLWLLFKGGKVLIRA
ncbi:DUF4386 domain-containing protein [Gracilibacillus kekensis]|uniref:DUF4386 domain-containing protein n=1 Tax=Gracilibacillus kekensis TaxID=1027249 RepID=A0A1M7LLB0_9BACI|nr:DUF4386 domain-containing protein [Gracilibacillus kekensis]SHM78423.1 protein of unknown function [Gracilibacillus kekensis]